MPLASNLLQFGGSRCLGPRIVHIYSEVTGSGNRRRRGKEEEEEEEEEEEDEEEEGTETQCGSGVRQLRVAGAVGKVEECRRGCGVEVRRWERGSGGVMHPGLAGNGGDHGIHARTYI